MNKNKNNKMQVTEERSVAMLTVQISELHNKITTALKATVMNAIEIGGMLNELKSKLPHGTFAEYVNDNFDFTQRTAQRYIQVYGIRDKLSNMNNLSDAYKILTHKEQQLLPGAENETDTTKQDRVRKYMLFDEDDFTEEFAEFIPSGASRNQKIKYGIARGESGMQPCIIHNNQYHVFAWEFLTELL